MSTNKKLKLQLKYWKTAATTAMQKVTDVERSRDAYAERFDIVKSNLEQASKSHEEISIQLQLAKEELAERIELTEAIYKRHVEAVNAKQVIQDEKQAIQDQVDLLESCIHIMNKLGE